jgi:hypothetical protein
MVVPFEKRRRRTGTPAKQPRATHRRPMRALWVKRKVAKWVRAEVESPEA